VACGARHISRSFISRDARLESRLAAQGEMGGAPLSPDLVTACCCPMLNRTSMSETVAQPADRAPSSDRTTLQLARDEQVRQLSVVKRLFDVLAATAAILIFAPLLAVLALVVRLAIGAPILFKQQRPGLHGRPFVIYKFRTMTDARDTAGALLPDRERLGRVGKFLRSTSLDELPELINVVRGEMSLVGPRPLLMEYLPCYSAEQMRRHDVLPGVTGLAQINGRNAASWACKFELDVWYVNHRSMWLDLKIIATTAWKVLKRDGHVTSERFIGNADAPQSGNREQV
jgi:sugar transferase EpsL